ncbi:tetratricopeptide repeat protein [Chryseobacterium cucumeris]
MKVKAKSILFILFILNNIYCYSQNYSSTKKEIDSLINFVRGKNAYANGSKKLMRVTSRMLLLSKSINYPRGMTVSISIMSEVYMNEQQYEKALKIIPEGKILAEKHNDYYSLAWLYIQEGMIYNALGYTKRSRKSLQQGLHLVNKISPNEAHLIRSTAYRILPLNIKKENQNNSDSILLYLFKSYDEAKKMYKSPIRNICIALSTIELSQQYYYQNDINNTEKYLALFETALRTENDKSEFIKYFILKGNIENKRRRYTKALEYFDKALQLTVHYKVYLLNLKEIYTGKSESFLGLQDYKNQAVYSEKAQKIADSILSTEKKTLNTIISKQNRTNTSEPQVKDKTKLLIIILILSISITVFVLYTFYVKKKKYHKTPESFTDSEKSTEENISLYKKDSSTENLTGLKLLVQNKDQSFQLKFSETFPTFNKQLLQINSQLTYSDLEYCALIRLNLDNKIIADYKNISPNSVISKKYRLRKKLNISKDENMYIWMLNLK